MYHRSSIFPIKKYYVYPIKLLLNLNSDNNKQKTILRYKYNFKTSNIFHSIHKLL